MGKLSYSKKIAELLLDDSSGDWRGSGAVLELYGNASGEERTAIIKAMGDLLEHHKDATVLAQVLHIASSLDLAELDGSVAKLRSKVGKNEPLVTRALDNYSAFRRLRASSKV